MDDSGIKMNKIFNEYGEKESLDDITQLLLSDILEFSKNKSLSIMETKLILKDNDEDYGNDETIDIKVVFRVPSLYIDNKLENKYDYYTTRNNKKH